MHCSIYSLNVRTWPNLAVTFAICGCFACSTVFRRERQGHQADTCNQSLARLNPPMISVWCLPCNTGHPNQNYQVHITKLHTNYRHQMHTTLPLSVGVIFAPQLSYFNSMSVCFTGRLLLVIAGLRLFQCVLSLSYNHRLTSDQSQAFLTS